MSPRPSGKKSTRRNFRCRRVGPWMEQSSSHGFSMNSFQTLWWEQTRSDHSVLLLMRRQGINPCQQLHYLQMVTEKLGKAYFWRTGRSPRKSHASLVRFLQALDDRPEPERFRIAELFGFGRAQDFENWIPTITPLAYAL